MPNYWNACACVPQHLGKGTEIWNLKHTCQARLPHNAIQRRNRTACSRNEGLLAITFKISGAAASPTLTINPLSAVTPGFLRNIFSGLDTPGMQIQNGGDDALSR